MKRPAENSNRVEALWREFSGPLLGFLRKRTANAADADDLLQEVFVRIHRQVSTLRDPSKMQGWVYRIARNAVIDHHRSRGRLPGTDFAPDIIAEAEEPNGRDVIDLTPTLRQFVLELPADYREPLVRYEFQGQSLQEVATALGLTLTATKSRVRRARLLLREMLDRCCRFEFDRRGRVVEATPLKSCDCHSKHC